MRNADSTLQKYTRYVALLLLPIFIAALFVVGSQPFAVGAFPVPFDKLAHLLVFSAFGLLLGAAAGLLPLRRSAVLLLALGCALAVGAADELHQATLPGRSADWADFFADTFGTIYGLWVLVRLGLAR